MRIFETKTQFIKEEEGFSAPEGMRTYSLTFTSDMNSSYRMEFPQYELFFRSSGGWGYASYLTLNYRGLTISPKSGENKEIFILNLLNNLKKGSYDKKMQNFFKERLSEEEYKKVQSVLNTKNIKIKQLEIEIASLQKEVANLKSDEQNKLIIELQEENSKLKEKLKSIRKLME